MKRIFLILAVVMLFSKVSIAQFSLEKFWSIKVGCSVSSVKQVFPNEKWEEKSADKLFTFYGMLKPSSIKISFMFTQTDQLRMKSISNSKTDNESAKIFFYQMKDILVAKFGNKYEQQNDEGKTLLEWNSIGNMKVILSLNKERAMLIVLEAVGIPFKGR
jgi:hypothetical protein